METIRILKFQHSFIEVSAMLKRYFSSSDSQNLVKFSGMTKRNESKGENINQILDINISLTISNVSVNPYCGCFLKMKF